MLNYYHKETVIQDERAANATTRLVKEILLGGAMVVLVRPPKTSVIGSCPVNSGDMARLKCRVTVAHSRRV